MMARVYTGPISKDRRVKGVLALDIDGVVIPKVPVRKNGVLKEKKGRATTWALYLLEEEGVRRFDKTLAMEKAWGALSKIPKYDGKREEFERVVALWEKEKGKLTSWVEFGDMLTALRKFPKEQPFFEGSKETKLTKNALFEGVPYQDMVELSHKIPLMTTPVELLYKLGEKGIEEVYAFPWSDAPEYVKPRVESFVRQTMGNFNGVSVEFGESFFLPVDVKDGILTGEIQEDYDKVKELVKRVQNYEGLLNREGKLIIAEDSMKNIQKVVKALENVQMIVFFMEDSTGKIENIYEGDAKTLREQL